MVRSFGLLDQKRSAQHDNIAEIACILAQTRWASIALVDNERVWLSGGANFKAQETCRWHSFCTHVVGNPQEQLWVEDATKDFRFARLPRVRNAPHLRFYAGAPIMVHGYAVGAVGVFDAEPRPFSPVVIGELCRLARIVADDLDARHRSQSMGVALLASADALINCDAAGLITYWSDGAEKLFGFSSAEALGSNIDIIVPTEFKAAHNQGFAEWQRSGVARTGRRIDLAACRKDGSLLDIELWMNVHHERGVPHIHANIRDISDRKAHARMLEASKIEAQKANEAKSTFLMNMSHELRTPLNGVVVGMDLLVATNLSDSQRELAAIVKSSSDQLRQLVGDILDLARVEQGELILTPTPMALDSLVDDVKNISTLAAQAKGLSLALDVEGDLSKPVVGDALRIKQVLTNLVANAVKFTDAGSVTIRVSGSAPDFRFEVSDTGIGFTDEQRAVIFDRFQQADGSITRRFGGTGLGLSICRELVAAMGGELGCSSRPGAGATFWFTLPLRVAEEPAAHDQPSNMTMGLRARFLVVDDNATNRRVATLLLDSIGADVVCVEDGKQAVEAFLRERFDAILMDMMMPVMDGIAATQAIRDIEQGQRLPRTPIIMLTASSLPQHIMASLAAGADTHLTKPINPAVLFETLGQLADNDDDAPPGEETGRTEAAG